MTIAIVSHGKQQQQYIHYYKADLQPDLWQMEWSYQIKCHKFI